MSKLEPITDGFVFHQTILKKGTRGSFHHWNKEDFNLTVTVLQTHSQDGFGRTPNVLEQTSTKVPMTSRFLALVGSLSLEEHLIKWYMIRIRGPHPIYST